MFFFIGGIQPKTVKLEDHPRMCPSCGLYQAHLRRIDHYISIFFLPILRVKKGIPYVICDRCGSSDSESASSFFGDTDTEKPISCKMCGKVVDFPGQLKSCL